MPTAYADLFAIPIVNIRYVWLIYARRSNQATSSSSVNPSQGSSNLSNLVNHSSALSIRLKNLAVFHVFPEVFLKSLAIATCNVGERIRTRALRELLYPSRPLFPRKIMKGEVPVYATTDGEKYYCVCLSTCQPVFLTKPFAYTYDTRAEALERVDELRKAGLRVGVVRY